MPLPNSLPLPAKLALQKLGRELAVARRKRRLSTADMSARLFVARDTLWRLEKGDPTVSVGVLATAVFILQLHEKLANLASPATDTLGLNLDEDRLPKRIRRVREITTFSAPAEKSAKPTSSRVRSSTPRKKLKRSR